MLPLRMGFPHAGGTLGMRLRCDHLPILHLCSIQLRMNDLPGDARRLLDTGGVAELG